MVGVTQWPQAATNLLIERWNAGDSAARVAARLAEDLGFAVSRSAVISRVRRLCSHGVVLRAGKGRNHAKRPRPGGPRRGAASIVIPAGASSVAPPDFPPPGTCLWLYGDPGSPGARWCGAPAGGHPLLRHFCPYHTHRALKAPPRAHLMPEINHAA